MADVVPLRVCNPASTEKPVLQDLPALLRQIATELENGEFGLKEAKEKCGENYVCRGALVLRISNQEPQVFGLGDTDLTQTFMDFHAGAQEIMNMHSPERST